MRSVRSLLVAVLVCTASGVRAQEAAPPAREGNAAAVQETPDKPATDGRTQYPKFMENSFFTFSVGFIGYRFNQRQLEPGFEAESIDKKKLAVRVDLFGHRFTKYLSAQAVYMRPAWFIQYNNINGTTETRQVSNAYGGATLSSDLYVSDLYLKASTDGVYLEHPLFVSWPDKGDPIPDSIDRFFAVKMNLAMTTSPASGSARAACSSCSRAGPRSASPTPAASRSSTRACDRTSRCRR